MQNPKIYCMCLHEHHLENLKKLNYIPVGLGKNHFSNQWVKDNENINISQKNPFYGEYTFHYWFWKNELKNLKEEEWVGFCQYRKFWTIKNFENLKLDIKTLPSVVLKEVPQEYQDCEAILGNPFYINQKKTMKFLKKGLKLIIKNPKILFNQKLRNIKFHFDLMHGENNLYKAIDLLDKDNKEDFRDYVNSMEYFHPQNMFICKSKNLLKKYYETIFPWLERCEKVFGFDNLTGYGKIRIYSFLAERFVSYWFKKNAKCKIMNITFYDIRDDIS